MRTASEAVAILNEADLLDEARTHLATAMLNQVGVEWDEACDSVYAVESSLRARGLHGERLVRELYIKAIPYEDM